MMSRFWRELRAKETRVFLLALTISTAAIVAPALLAERLNSGVRSYTAELLGGDIRLSSSRQVDATLLAAAAEYGLISSLRISASSVLYNTRNEVFQLVRVRAVKDNYPLRGQLDISQQIGASSFASKPPGLGEIWLDTRAAQLLQAEIGDQVEVGETSLLFTAYLQNQPASPSFFAFAPQSMINMADLEATNLILPGSRIRYNYFWAGDANSVRQYAARLQNEKDASSELTLIGDQNQNFSDILQRLNSFLMLSGALTVILAAMALVLTSRYYLNENSRYIALLKTLGYTPKQVLSYLGIRLLPPTLTAYLIGCLCGWLGYLLIGNILQEFLPAAQSNRMWRPFGLGFMSLIICLFAFALPNLAQLINVPPYSVLRASRLAGPIGRFYADRTFLITGASTCAGIFVLIFIYTGNLIVSLSLLGGLLGFITLIALLNYATLRLAFARLIRLGAVWRISLSSLYRNWSINSLQIMAFATAFMLIGILAVMRISLINDWQEVIKPGTPNNFLINIAPSETSAVKDFMNKNAIATEDLSGIVRGKLVTVNGESLVERTKRLGTYDNEAEREFNLGWSPLLPAHNRLEKGRWWSPLSSKQEVYPVSIESGIAQDFGLDLNDQLTFRIGGVELRAYVANFRVVDWGDFKPNFYVLFPPIALESFPRTFITSFYLPSEQAAFLKDFVRRFPTISLISIESVMRQVAAIFNLVSNAMQLILSLGIIAALAVFFATLQVSIRMRSITTATLRLIGESNAQAMAHNLLEFCFLGFFGGLLAAVGTEIVIYCIFTFFLEQEFSFHYYLLLSPLFGMLLAGLAGFIWCRRAIVIPPQRLLKKVL